jgi:peptidoglycan/xylan/chitin deacetylase (PgdA/CDA1 family)
MDGSQKMRFVGWEESAKRRLVNCDEWLAAACLSLMPDRPGLLIFAFHGLFESAEEIAGNAADPQQAITASMFRGFVEHFVNNGYRFVSAAETATGLDPAAKYAMISFDDGYANNRRALPTMEEFQVPALFSISVNHVRTGKPFWWDVLYREARKRGWEDARLDGVRVSLKRLRTCEIEQRLVAAFGEKAFQTVSVTDRPFTTDELAEFARHPLVEIGNHTRDHAILTNYPVIDACDEIGQAQDWLREIAGKTPQVIAYPNGNVSQPVLRAVQDADISLGLTGQPGRNSIVCTRSGMSALLLKRHTLWGCGDIGMQCRVARSPFSLHAAAAAVRSKIAGHA